MTEKSSNQKQKRIKGKSRFEWWVETSPGKFKNNITGVIKSYEKLIKSNLVIKHRNKK